MNHLRTLYEKQLVRFVLVGVINTLFSYAIYCALVFAGLSFAFANLIALVLGIVFSFKTQGRLVFRNSGGRQFVKFVLVWGILYFVSVVIIGKLTIYGLSAYRAGAVALFVTSVLSYVAQKFFIFRKTELSGIE